MFKCFVKVSESIKLRRKQMYKIYGGYMINWYVNVRMALELIFMIYAVRMQTRFSWLKISSKWQGFMETMMHLHSYKNKEIIQGRINSLDSPDTVPRSYFLWSQSVIQQNPHLTFLNLTFAFILVFNSSILVIISVRIYHHFEIFVRLVLQSTVPQRCLKWGFTVSFYWADQKLPAFHQWAWGVLEQSTQLIHHSVALWVNQHSGRSN